MDLSNTEIVKTVEKKHNTKSTITTFIVLVFLFSSVFWYLTAGLPEVEENATQLLIYTLAAMWCPAVAAVLTRLLYRRNLKGFGFRLGRARWLFLGMLIPILVGLVMFGSAWVFGIAPLDVSGVNRVFSPRFIPILLLALVVNCFAASGEELGWRGFLVPELSRCMGFTGLALVSGAIWTAWHFPLIIFSAYHGAGPLWHSFAFFIPSVVSASFVLAWLRLASGSIWPVVFFHGFWNYFIQRFYPLLTVQTPAGDKMLGEFGWFVVIAYVSLALAFWRFRNLIPNVKH